MKKWFKAKHYGWGWYPSSWQGWIIMLVWIIAIVFTFRQIDSSSHSASDTLINMAIPFAVLTAALVIICYATGEKPRWRWGGG